MSKIEKKVESQQSVPKDDLTSLVLQRIEEEKVTPVSPWIFLCIHCFVWVSWFASVLLGAIAVAVVLYVLNHARFALYEATHDSPLSFFMDTIPYVWVGLFILMGTLAYINMRHTKSGYKYPMWGLLLSSVLLSICAGLLLHMYGIGYMVDTSLAQKMPVYQSLERAESHMWQRPEEGRLLGVFGEPAAPGKYDFTDTHQVQWSVETAELREQDMQLLDSGAVVRVLGTTTDPSAKVFHACGVFPWLFDSNVSVQEMRKDRQLFIQRMYDHMEKGQRSKRIEYEVFREDHDVPFQEEGVCADLAVMKRMEFVQ